ncbi:isopentenyl-diphosphate Delta-isomerase [Corynebacterium striatum]
MTELVVLAGSDGLPAGTADKAAVHTTDTPLHFAFSAWVLREGKVLVTRRALSKKTWPGVWTNAFCGHPAPGEENAAAVIRRAHFELGLAISEVREVLPDFSYRAVDSSGIVEHEICPVFLVELAPRVEPQPNPDEVDSYEWVDPAELIRAAEATPFAFSPWMVEELAEAPLRQVLA